MQQGGVRFNSEAQEESKIVSTVRDESKAMQDDEEENTMIGDTTFEFDPLISPENRFI